MIQPPAAALRGGNRRNRLLPACGGQTAVQPAGRQRFSLRADSGKVKRNLRDPAYRSGEDRNGEDRSFVIYDAL